MENFPNYCGAGTAIRQEVARLCNQKNPCLREEHRSERQR